jgi:hypothetical protein
MDASVAQIRNEIFVISLGGSVEVIQEKQEVSKGTHQSVILSWYIKPLIRVNCAEIDLRLLKRNATSPIRHLLTTEDIKRLQPLRWLNDDLITFGFRYLLTALIVSIGTNAQPA